MELNELIESIDIVDFLSQFVDLEEKNGEYWGLSPFKDEKTPSFSVRRETNSFYCFSSGIGGNVVTFLKFYYKISGAEAVEKLKEYAGITSSISVKKKMTATLHCKKFLKPKQTRKATSGVVLPNDYMERYEVRDDKLAVWDNSKRARGCFQKGNRRRTQGFSEIENGWVYAFYVRTYLLV